MIDPPPNDANRGVDDRPVVRRLDPPPPISGGTLAVMNRGDTAVAADPDRDLVYVADLLEGRRTHIIELSPGDEPGRVVADAAGRAHVVTRRGGTVVEIDPLAGRVVREREVCSNPRGIAYDEDADRLHVACAGGDLVSLSVEGDASTRRVRLMPDLRDVVVTDEGLTVTRFRSAHVLHVDHDGTLLDEHAPSDLRPHNGSPGHLRPNTAWRTVGTPDGDWLMLHQASTDQAVDLHANVPDGGRDGGYGGGPDPCAPVVNPVLTRGSGALDLRTSPLLGKTVLAVDVAVSPGDYSIAVAVAGRNDDRTPVSGVVWVDPQSFTSAQRPRCDVPEPLPVGPGQYVAVTFDPQGRIVAQSREPAGLVRIDPWRPEVPTLAIPLAGNSRADTGHDLFHRDAGGGISCASCHPEGGDDGHLWVFDEMGVRHTPSLDVGLRDTEPFHWDGSLSDAVELMDQIHAGRMGGRHQSLERVDALEAWMFSIQTPRPQRSLVDPAALRGAASFAAWGCNNCHFGEALDGGPDNVWLGHEFSLQVPPLRGVAMHPPYMHDGRAEDLRGAVLDMLSRTRADQPTPPEDEIDELIAYLESL
ncbi:MAG: cytochrome-c peroxidase [Myxococcota bacterium]